MSPYYKDKDQFLVALDCVIFGFYEGELHLLLLQRNFEPDRGKWSVMGGFLAASTTDFVQSIVMSIALIVVVASVDVEEKTLASGPDIVSRGFVYVREAEELMEEVRRIATKVLTDALDSGVTEWTQMKNNVKESLTKYLFNKTKRKPMILPVIMRTTEEAVLMAANDRLAWLRHAAVGSFHSVQPPGGIPIHPAQHPASCRTEHIELRAFPAG